MSLSDIENDCKFYDPLKGMRPAHGIFNGVVFSETDETRGSSAAAAANKIAGDDLMK